MSFFSKLVKGVGKAVGGIVKVGAGLVSKLNIPIVSGAAGIVSGLAGSLTSGGSSSGAAQQAALQQPIAVPMQTSAQAATFGGTVNVGGVSGSVGSSSSWLTQKTIFSWAPNWVVVILAPGIVVLVILYFIFKRRRR